MAWVIWITGLPGSGKTTLARAAAAALREGGRRVRILHLDEIRRVLTPRPTYDEAERDLVYAALACLARILWEEGINVLVDATAHRRAYRERARSLIPSFAEVYLRCPLAVCEVREAVRASDLAPPGIYAAARTRGAPVPGMGVPYEAPERPELTVDTARIPVEEAAAQVCDLARRLEVAPARRDAA
jgi:adenylylsulfate kinase